MQRKSIPQNLKQVLMVSKYLTLYMVDSYPPKHFSFVDPLGNNFKVSIDNKVSCSCLPGNRDHCMHTFYVLAKIYKLADNDPLLFQKGYTEVQLEHIFKGGQMNKNNMNIKQQKKQEIEIENQKIDKEIPEVIQQRKKQSKKYDNNLNSNHDVNQKQSKSFIKPIQTLKKEISQLQSIKNPIQQQKQYPKLQFEQPLLEKGAICSICYQQLQNQTPLLKCPSQCFSYFHIKCLRFWSDYQTKQQALPSCPMCRARLPQNMSEVLKKGQNAWTKYYLSFQISCGQCGQEIRSKLFRCLLCPSRSCCSQCYFSFKHLSHDRYLMKKSKRAEWSIPQSRAQASMAKLQASLQYVKQFKNQQQMKTLFGENYNRFLEANIKKETLLEYLIASLTSVQKEVYKTYKKLDYEEKDIRCMLCKKGKVIEMRRLQCRHFIDEKCLSFLLLNGERFCPFDKTPFLEALPTLSLAITKK